MYSNESDASAIIAAARENQVVEIDGVSYGTGNFGRIKNIPSFETIELTSLEAFANFITEEPQAVLDEPIVVINENHVVRLLNTPKQENLKRDNLATVRNSLESFNFNHYMSIEDMIIQLQTKFIITDTVKRLLTILSSVSTTQDISIKDNGTSQSTNIKRGISAASLEEVELPNIVKLQPIRIFTECDQVESRFLFRIKQKDEIPYVSLMDVDPTEWKIKASKSILNKMRELGILLPIYY
ncbi:MAG: hypothetical protein PQJ49_11210 [Sphaerochaetaceae bacterium]|nr:hypothetical protein [Sphaerochaetaceae bacterium]